MDIKELEKMNIQEIEALQIKSHETERTMLNNLNMLDERASKLDRENIMKDLELKDLRTSIKMANRNLRVLTSEIETIDKYYWKALKGR